MKKIKLKNKIYLLQDKKSNTVTFNLVFEKEYDEIDSFYIKLLKYIIPASTKRYKNLQNYTKAKQELLVIENYFSYERKMNISILKYNFKIPKKNLVKGYKIQDAFDFAIQTLLEPKIKDSKFDEKLFDYNHEYVISNFQSRLQNNNFLNEKAFYEYVDKNEIISLKFAKMLQRLKDITNQDLYNFYKNIFNQNKYVVTVMGNTTEEEVTELFSKYKKFDNKTFECLQPKPHFIRFKKYNEKSIKSYTNQSQLFLGYQVKGFKWNERIYTFVLSDILSRLENPLLFDKLRIKNNLVYGFNMDSFTSSNLHVISINANKSKKEKIIKLITETIDSLKEEKHLKKYINTLIESLEMGLLREQDETYYKYRNYLDKVFKFYNDERYIRDIKKIDVTKFMEFISRFELTTVFLCEGEN